MNTFRKCTSLTEINIPQSVETIGQSTFEGCTSLSSVTMGNNVTSLGSKSFFSCSALTTINLSENITEIGSMAFWQCYSLTSITIPSGVTTINVGMFDGCSGLTSVNIPSGLTSIKNGAFAYCTNLSAITVPSGVTEIGERAFQNCTQISAITIPDGVTEIKDRTFLTCIRLSAVTIPQSVQSIGIDAFENCLRLKSITVLATTPPALGEKAFDNTNNCPILVHCQCLTRYREAWPELVDRIQPMEGVCPSKLLITNGTDTVDIPCDFSTVLTKQEVNDTSLRLTATDATIGECVTEIGSEALYYCGQLTAVTIPDSVTKVGGYSFQGCSGLTSLDIPSGVTEIGNYAFSGCNHLESIAVNASTPPALGVGVLSSTNNCPILVPCQSVDAYKAADGWKSYASRIQAIEGSCDKCVLSNSVTSETIPCNDSISISWQEIQATQIHETAFNATLKPCITRVGHGGFSAGYGNCYNLETVNLNNITVIGNLSFQNLTKLLYVSLPKITEIGSWAFNGCSGLTYVTIGDSITSIGQQAFYGCSSLTKITVKATTPPSLGSNAFDNTNNCQILVPAASVDTYKSASGWSDYASRIQAIPNS